MEGKVVILSTALPCSKFLSDGSRCLKNTRWGLSFETRRGDVIIFPYCEEHLPTNRPPTQNKKKQSRKEEKGYSRRR